jgi:chemotaxis signal transduction protein
VIPIKNGKAPKNGKTLQSKGFDWERAKALATSSLDDGGLDLQEIFRERARVLSKPEHEESDVFGEEFLRFRVGPFSFAIRLDQVGSVIRPTWVTEVPGAPDYVARVIHVGGRIIAVADLAILLGTRLKNVHQDWRVLLVENGRQRIGLLTTAVRDIVSLELSGLSNLSSQQSQVASFVHGATHDMTLVLDGVRLIDELRVRSASAQR